jgi:sugar lactone lactonase YvrE
MSVPRLDFPVHVFDERPCLTGEGPVWDGSNLRVVWVDVLGSRVLWRSLSEGTIGECDMPSHVGAVLPTVSSDWLVFLQDGVYLTRLDGALPDLIEKFPIAAPDQDLDPLVRANDAKVGPDGIAYVGVMAYDTEKFPNSGALYRLEQGILTVSIPGTTLSNGIDWSPDGQTMYHVDSARGTIEAFNFESGPILDTRRVIAYVDPSLGVPDGMSVDVEGNLWIGLWDGGGIVGMDASGDMFGFLPIPCQHATSCAFVGNDLRTLVVTTARFDLEPDPMFGATFIVEMPVAGRPQSRAHVPSG